MSRIERGSQGDASHCPVCDAPPPPLTLGECYSHFWDGAPPAMKLDAPQPVMWSAVLLAWLMMLGLHLLEWVPLYMSAALRAATCACLGYGASAMGLTFADLQPHLTSFNVAVFFASATVAVLVDPRVAYWAQTLQYALSVTGVFAGHEDAHMRVACVYTATRVAAQLLDLARHGTIGYESVACMSVVLGVAVVAKPAKEALARAWSRDALMDARVRMEWCVSAEARDQLTD